MADQWVEENFKGIAFDDGLNTWSLAKNYFVSFKDQHLVKYSKSEGILKIWINFVREIDQALSNAVEFLMPFSKVMAENINFKLGSSIITKSNFDSKHIKCHKNIRVKSSDNQDYLSPKIDDKPLKSSFSNLTSVNILYDKTSDNSTSDDLIWTWEGSELSENERKMAKIPLTLLFNIPLANRSVKIHFRDKIKRPIKFLNNRLYVQNTKNINIFIKTFNKFHWKNQNNLLK